MSNPTTAGTDSDTTRTAGRTGTGEVATRDQTSGPVTEHGRTTVSDLVVQKIAGLAAREVAGVHDLGGGMTRAFSALRERIPGASASSGQGVAVEVGEKQAAADLDMVVEYGAAIPDLSRAVRRNVIAAVERMTGLEVVEVNISVNDVYLPGDENGESSGGSGRVE
jgi:uncharacterized alkaline shock family protein YloU